MLKGERRSPDLDLIRLGLRASAALLRQEGNRYRHDSTARHLSEVLASCLNEAEFSQEIGEVFDAYLSRVKRFAFHTGALETSAAVLAEKATFRFLDGVFLDPDLTNAHRHWVFREGIRRKNPLSTVCTETLLDWCRQGDFNDRLLMISGAIYPFEERREGNRVVLSEQSRRIIDVAQEPSVVLRNLCSSVRPISWSGSQADIIAHRRQALETLLEHDRPDIRAAAATHIVEIRRWEEQERRHEQDRDRQREQRFEW